MALIQCSECGAMVSDQATSCPKCGTPINPSSAPIQQPAYQQVAPTQQYQPTPAEDIPSAGMNVLSFFVPVAGWILWGVNKSKTPKKASACAKWAWIGFAVTTIINIIAAVA